jgi:hypothetical protein
MFTDTVPTNAPQVSRGVPYTARRMLSDDC